jgi:translation initiation factor IF-2
MRVYEVAREFNIEPERMLQLLRGMGVRAVTEASAVDDATIAKLRARMERERRAGHTDVEETLEAVVEDVQTTTTKRRRRKKADLPEPEPEPEPELVATVEEVPETKQPQSLADIFRAADERAAAEAAAAAALAASEEAAAAAVVETLEVAEPVLVEPLAEAPAPVVEAATPVEPPAVPGETMAAAAPATPVPPLERVIPESARPKLRRAADVLGRMPSRQPAAPSPGAAAGGTVRIQAEGFTADGRRSGAAPVGSGPAAPVAGGGKKADKKKKGKRRVDQDAVQENIARVLSELKGGGKKRRHRRDEAPSRLELAAERQRRAAEEAQTVRVNEFLTVAELAELIDVPANQIIGSAFKNLGLMVTIN